MKHTARWTALLLTFVLAAGLMPGRAADKEKAQQPKENQGHGGQRQMQGQGQGHGQGQGQRSYPQGQGQGAPNRGYPGTPGNPGVVHPGQGNQRPGQPGQPGTGTRNVPRQPDQPAINEGKSGKVTAPRNAPEPVERNADRNPNKNQDANPGRNQNQNQNPDRNNDRRNTDLNRTAQPRTVDRSPPAPIRPPMKEVRTASGDLEQRSPDGKLRGVTRQDRKTGETRTQQISATGRIEREQVVRTDGSTQTRELDLGNREKRVTMVRGGNRETTDVHYDRTGAVRARETVVVNNRNVAVSRTVVVKQNFVVKNTTVVNVHTHRHYHPCHWGFVYTPLIVAPALYISWYDPFWYGPVHHHFTFSWGWSAYPWYRYNAYYWQPYPVYAAPSYWVTDWMVAGYMADRYAIATSVEQTREEVRLAREEAEKARVAAEQAKNAAEIAEAKAAQAQAEARAERAEARIAKAQAEEERRKTLGDKPNPNATPITKETKDQLKNQVEQTIVEKKALADKGENAVSPDVTEALKDPKHVYPVSKSLSVVRAEDSKPAGTLTPGDFLKAEPGQDAQLKNANEGTLIQMRVITSKGEDDSVPAGTVVLVPLKELQEFDNEFRAKIDLGLAEADKNKDEFKRNAVAQ